MTLFQIESNKVLPTQGSLLISAPFLKDYHFARSVILMVEHNEEGSMGIVLNKNYRVVMNVNDLVPELGMVNPIPLYNGGPISRDTLFYIHTLSHLKGALPLPNGLYVNGDFEALKKYILDGGPTKGIVRFFTGYAGWMPGQLMHEIEENTWIVNNGSKMNILDMYLRDLWQEGLSEMGGKYTVWSRFPKYPIMN